MFNNYSIDETLKKLSTEEWDNEINLFKIFSKNLVPEEYYSSISKRVLKNPIFINEALKNNPNLYKISDTEAIKEHKSAFLNTLHTFHKDKFISFLSKEDLIDYENNNLIISSLNQYPQNYKYLNKEQRMNPKIIFSVFHFNPKSESRIYLEKDNLSNFDASIVKFIPIEYFNDLNVYTIFLVNLPRSLKYLPKKIFQEEDFLYLSCINQSNLLINTMKGYADNPNFLHNLMLTNKMYQSYFEEHGFNYPFECNNKLYQKNKEKFYTYKKALPFVEIIKNLPIDFFTEEFYSFTKQEGPDLVKTDNLFFQNHPNPIASSTHLLAEIFPSLSQTHRKNKMLILDFLENLKPEKFNTSNMVTTITSYIEDMELKNFLRQTFKNNKPKGDIKEKLLDYAKTYYLNKELSDKMVKKPEETTQQFKI